MFNNLFGKSKKISFDLPTPTFLYDSKTVSKLSSKDLILLCTDQDKYLSILLKKFDSIKQQYTRMTDKVEELTEKNQVINAETVRMSNQHQELVMKYKDLENGLEIVLREKERGEKEEKGRWGRVKEIVEGEGGKVEDVEGRLREIIKEAHMQQKVFKNIESQNNKLKEKIEQLQQGKQKIEQQFNKLKEIVKELQRQITQLSKQNERIKAEIGNIQSVGKGEEGVGKITMSTFESNSEAIEKMQSPTYDTVSTQTVQQHKQQAVSQPINKQQYQSPSIQLHHQPSPDQSSLISSLQLQLQKYTLLQQLLLDQQLKSKSQQSLTHTNSHILSLQKKQSSADDLQKRIITLINNLKEKRETIHYLEKLNQELRGSYGELEKEVKGKQKEGDKVIEECKKREEKYLLQKIQILRNHQQLSQTLTLRTSQLQQLQKKLRKQQTQLSTTSIKSQSLRKSIDKLTDQNKSYKQTIQKKYQQSVIYIQKATQLEDKVKEYKKEIQRLKMERVEMEQGNQGKVQELMGRIREFEGRVEGVRREAERVGIEKEGQMGERVKRLEEEIGDLQIQNQRLVKRIEEYEESQQKDRRVIQELSQKREHAIMQIQRLQKLNSVKGRQGKVQTTNDVWAGSKSTEKPKEKVEQKEKVDRTKKVAEKSYKAFNIILKLLESLYKEFVNDYMGEIKQVRVQKLENAINQLITKTTDMKDIFRDYM